MNNDIFKGLFVLELARNHWGDLERGKKIIRAYAEVVKKHGIKAAIKLQFFDTDTFVHPDYHDHKDIVSDGENNQAPGTNTRYIKKTLATRLSHDECKALVDEIKSHGLYTMVTPYDEASVDLCGRLNVDMMKLASSDTGCITLLEKVIALGKPLSISTGVVNLDHIDRVVTMCAAKNIPLAINQCVSNYPTDDGDLQMKQITYWRNRYPDTLIGFSSHDYTDITRSHMIAHTLGARTYERHIDLELGDNTVQKYCIVPEDADRWFAAHQAVMTMLGDSDGTVREVTDVERGYINSVNRGVYAKRDLPEGYTFSHKGLGTDFYLAIPLQEGQISSREIDQSFVLGRSIKKDQPITHHCSVTL